MVEAEAPTRPVGGIQSVDIALRVLDHLSRAGGPVSLSELARDCDMPPSKVHRYLASYIAAGMVVQAGRSGKYDLGPAALQLGLSAMARHDFVNACSDALPDLRDATGMTVLLSVWGTQGATVVRWERAPAPVITSMGLGTTLPLLTSASGRVFLSWAAPEAIALRLAFELETTALDAEALRQQTRKAGYASVDGRFIPGLVACAAPILDWQGHAQCAITLIGTDPASVKPGAKQIESLTSFCQNHSINDATQDIKQSTKDI